MQKYACLFVYLIAYIQVAPAIESNITNQIESDLESSDKQLEGAETHPHQKRFIGALIAIITGVITAATATIISTQVNRAIERANPPPSDDRANTINIVINNNYAQAQALKEEVTRAGGAGNAIRVSPGGFQCDANFCRETGDGQCSLGICSPDICHCTNGQPILQQCGTGTVFDPLHRVCTWPYNVKICGY